MKIKLLSAAIILSLTHTSNSFANEEDDYYDDFYGDEEFVSIATGTKKAIHTAPAVATVITADDIEMMGANTIHQVIESVTGIHYYPSNVNRMNPSYSIRGIHTAENQQVLVLVNGLHTTFSFSNSKWHQFGVGINLIDRVEVIRGPGSAVYGADAFSGVINIITKGSNSLFENDAGIKAGSFGLKSGWLNFGHQSGDLKLSLNGQWQSTDGDDDRFINADAFGRSGSLDTRHEYTDLHAQVDYNGFYTKLWHLDIEAGTGAGAFQVLSDSDVTKGEAFSLQSGYQFTPIDDLDIDASFHYQRYEQYTFFKIFPDGYQQEWLAEGQVAGEGQTVSYPDGFLGAPIGIDKVYGAKVISTYRGLDKHVVRVEVGYQNNEETTDELKNFSFPGAGITEVGQTVQDGTLVSVKGTNAIYLGDTERRLSYLSMQDEWAFASDWELTAGLRIDNYSDFGTTVNPRLALVWQTQHNLTTKLLYGSAYRAPSFGELFASNNPIQLGNKDLKPEQNDTVEIAFDYRPHIDWVIALNIFRYQSKDLIGYVGTRQENSLEQDGKGAELEVTWKVDTDLKVKLGYAYQSSEDSNGNTIPDAPKSTLDATVTYKINDNLNLYADSFWVMDRARAQGDIREAIDDFLLTNLNMMYQLDNMKFNLSIRNLFDEDARAPTAPVVPGIVIAEDYPLEGRGVWLSAKVNF